MIKAIFFDFDDTLCNTSASREERARLAAERLCRDNPQLSVEAVKTRILEPAPIWPRGVSPTARELGLDGTEAMKEAVGLWFFDGCEHLLSLSCLPETIQTLSQTYKLGVITNGVEARQRLKFDALKVTEYFSVFVTSERVGIDKPDRRIFEVAAREAGVQTDECLFVGDRLDVDVIGAREAGMKAVWFDDGGVVPQLVDGVVPDATVRSLDEIAGILEGLAQ